MAAHAGDELAVGVFDEDLDAHQAAGAVNARIDKVDAASVFLHVVIREADRHRLADPELQSVGGVDKDLQKDAADVHDVKDGFVNIHGLAGLFLFFHHKAVDRRANFPAVELLQGDLVLELGDVALNALLDGLALTDHLVAKEVLGPLGSELLLLENLGEAVDFGDRVAFLDFHGGEDTLHGGADGNFLEGEQHAFRSVGAQQGRDGECGQQGNDIIFGGDGDDDLIGGHNVSGGQDGNDVIDGGTGFDVIVGDNAAVLRTGDNISSRLRVLVGNAMLDARGNFLTLPAAQAWPFDVQERAILILDHAFDTDTSVYGVDHLVGGAGADMLLGQLGDDFIHGDAFIPVNIATDGTIDRAAVRTAAAALFSTDFWVGADSDGDDYIEGGGGDDLIFGGLGQDDIAGGSSSLFGLTDRTLRPDGADTIYGGNGTAAAIDDVGDTSPNGRSRDADVILGDNGNIIRLVGINGINSGAFLSFGYAVDGTDSIIVRGFDLLDYTVPESSADDIGGNDKIYGEAGDDTLHGMVGDDLLYGNGQDDNLYGGNGDDFIEGGFGDDAISHNDELKGQISQGTLGAAEPGAETLLGGSEKAPSDPAAPPGVAVGLPSNLPVAFIFFPGSLKLGAESFAGLLLGFNNGRSWLATETDPVYANGGSEWRIFDAGIFTSALYGALSSLQGPPVPVQQFTELLAEEMMTFEGSDIPPHVQETPQPPEVTPPPQEPTQPTGEEPTEESPPVEEEPQPPEE